MPNITTQTIRVELNTGKEIPTAFTHQNDTRRTFVFNVYLNGAAYDMSGFSVAFAYMSPKVNGMYMVITGNDMVSGSVNGNTVSVTLPVEYTQISGVGMLTMIITPSSGTVRPVNIRLVVQRSADGSDTIAGASDFPATLQEYADYWLDHNIEFSTLNASTKCNVAFSGTNTPTFDGGTLTLPGTKLIMIADNRHSSQDYTYETINAMISDASEITEDGLVITVPDEGYFGFNVETKQFIVHSGYDVAPEVAPLYYRRYNYCWGRLADFFLLKNTKALTTKTEQLSADITTESGSTDCKIAMPSGRRPTFSENGSVITFAGTQLYIIADNTEYRTAYTFETIHSQVANYTEITNDGLVLTMPEEGVFGFNVKTKRFIMLRNYNIPFEVAPLYYRYYGTCFGRLADSTIMYAVNMIMDQSSWINAISSIFNGQPFTGNYDWRTPTIEYGALFNGMETVESYAFFSDPHIMGFEGDSWDQTQMENYLKKVQKTYNSSPCSFLVCGGDWLNSSTQDEACYRLSYVKGIADHMFDNCKLVVGNHDTNYYGKVDSSSEAHTGKLSTDTIASIMFRDTDTQKAYYSFDGANSKCYVLDTDIAEDHSEPTTYDWEQINWLAEKLQTDDAPHSIIFLHIIVSVSAENVQSLAQVFGQLIQAYNSHTSVTISGHSYNFTGCTGKMELWQAGHLHADTNGTLGGVPYVITATRGYSSDEPILDLVLLDYVGRKAHLVRAGTLGESRTINLA